MKWPNHIQFHFESNVLCQMSMPGFFDCTFFHLNIAPNSNLVGTRTFMTEKISQLPHVVVQTLTMTLHFSLSARRPRERSWGAFASDSMNISRIWHFYSLIYGRFSHELQYPSVNLLFHRKSLHILLFDLCFTNSRIVKYPTLYLEAVYAYSHTHPHGLDISPCQSLMPQNVGAVWTNTTASCRFKINSPSSKRNALMTN